MTSNLFKQGLFLTFILAFLAGCTSTATTDEIDDGAAAIRPDERGGTSGTTDRSRLRFSGDDADAALDTVIFFGFAQVTLQPETRALLLAHAERLTIATNN